MPVEVLGGHDVGVGTQKSDVSLRRGYLIALGAALLLYVVSVAPGELWQDSGLAQVRVLQRDLKGSSGLALSHPLYYAIAILFQGLPFSQSAYKTNLVSAIFGALTVANVALLLRRLTGRWDAAAIGATSLAVSHTFWQHCSLAEVYSVSTAILSGQLLSLERFFATRHRAWIVLAYLLSGVEFSNHPLALLTLAVTGLVTLWMIARKELHFFTLVLCGAAWFLGAGLMLALMVRQVAAGMPVTEVLRSALVGDFSAAVFNLFPTPLLLARSALYLVLNFPTPIALLAFVGLARLRSLRPPHMGVFLAGLTLIHLYWAIRYDVPDQYTFFIITAMNLSILIGIGVSAVLEWKPQARKPLVALALLPVAAYFLLPRLAAHWELPLGTRSLPYREEYYYFLRPWKTGYIGPEHFADEMFSWLPPFSVLIADQTTVRPLHYRRLTSEPDHQLLIFPRMRDEVGWDGADEDFLLDRIRAGGVYVVTPFSPYVPEWLLSGRYEFEKAGSVFRVVLRGASSTSAPSTGTAQ